MSCTGHGRRARRRCEGPSSWKESHFKSPRPVWEVSAVVRVGLLILRRLLFVTLVTSLLRRDLSILTCALGRRFGTGHLNVGGHCVGQMKNGFPFPDRSPADSLSGRQFWRNRTKFSDSSLSSHG